jgi:hypothetical protein
MGREFGGQLQLTEGGNRRYDQFDTIDRGGEIVAHSGENRHVLAGRITNCDPPFTAERRERSRVATPQRDRVALQRQIGGGRVRSVASAEDGDPQRRG